MKLRELSCNGTRDKCMSRSVRRDELLPARSGPTSQIDLVYGPRALCTLTAELPSEAIYIMTLA